jgi:hypothetical protein
MTGGRTAARRRIAAAGVAVLAAAALAGCPARAPRSPREEVVAKPTPTPRPSPTRRPRPRATPLPSPLPRPSPTQLPAPFSGPTRDVTREPLTRGVDSRTPMPTARALETAERARVELQSGTTERAIELADEALRISPATVPAWVVRARALLAEGSPELARGDLDHAATLDPDAAWMAEIVALTGATYEAEGKKEGALAAYRRAVVIFPANQTARDGLRRLSGP